MHKVLAAYLRRFTVENSIADLDEAKQFEVFTTFAVISSFFPDLFDPQEFTTTENDWSIDGLAVVIDDQLVETAEEAEQILKNLRPRQQARVEYLFVQAKRSESFDSGDMLKFGDGVKRLFETSDTPPDDLLREAKRMHEVVVNHLGRVETGRPTCRLFFICTGTWNEDSGLRTYVSSVEETLRSTSYFDEVHFLPVDRERLIALWLASENPVEATIPVKSFMPLPQISGVTEAYLALAPAPDFVDTALADPSGRIRSSVFDQNVRAFLGDENPVNQAIAQVVKDPEQHDRFSVLNNGITLVSRDVRIQSDRIHVKDFQIVNGCQTSHVLFRNRAALSQAIQVPLKVIEAEDPEVVAQVVAATNSQTAVEQQQFLSVRPFVRRLETYFNSFDEADAERRLYFERRTRQYVGHELSRNRIFDIQKIARGFAAMFLDLPHLAAGFPAQTISERQNQLFRDDHREAAYYTAAYALYRLDLLMGNSYVSRKFMRFKWHILMVLRYQQAGRDAPPLNSKKLDDYCERILAGISVAGKASAPPFQKAADLLQRLGLATKDQLKRERYTNEIREALRLGSKRGAQSSSAVS